MHEITQARRGMGVAEAPCDLGSGPLDDGLPCSGEPPRDRPAVYAITHRQLVQAQMVDELVPKQIPLSCGQLADHVFERLLQELRRDVTAEPKLGIIEGIAQRVTPNVLVVHTVSPLPSQIIEGESDSAHSYELGEVSSTCSENNRGWAVVSGDEQSMTKPLHDLLDGVRVSQHLLRSATRAPKVASFEPLKRPAVARYTSDRQADFDKIVERRLPQPTDRGMEQRSGDPDVGAVRANGLERSGGQHVQSIRTPVPGDSRR